jgi:protein-glutamine gamma-glutamyltransferase
MARDKRPVSQRQTWWLLAAALSAFLPLATLLTKWLIIGAGATMVLRGWMTYRQWRLPPRWLLVVLTIAATAGVIYEYRTMFGRLPGVSLLTAFLALKLLELRGARDAMAVVLLCYFLVLTQFMFTQSIATALMACATVLITTATLVAANDDRPAPKLIVRRAGTLLVQGLPFMLLLFILFPRVQGPLWGIPQDRMSAITGLSDSMSPGSIAQLSQSDTIAFRVQFDGPTPPQHLLYWRGPVMPSFDGQSWRIARNTPRHGTPPYQVAGTGQSYNVTLEPLGKSWIFALDYPEKLPPDSAYTEDFQLLNRTPVRTRLRYSMNSFGDTSVGADETSAMIAESLALPPRGNPRTREVARQWRETHGNDAEAIVAAAELFFLRQLLSYTLNPPLLADDVIDGFLFESKKGFCEHFASAFAFALRSAGVPTRVVAGYQGGEVNPVDGNLTVRQYDAHAWTEVWLKGRGWVRFDPTAISAPRRIADNFAAAAPENDALPFLARANMAWLREVRNRMEAATNVWNQWVLGYTPQRQKEFLQSLGFKSPDWQEMTAALAALCGAFLLLLTAWILYQRKRVDPAIRAWLKFTQRLGKRGVQWNAWEDPLVFSERAANALPAHAESIRSIAKDYANLRYAAPTAQNDANAPLAKLRASIDAFRP